MPSWVADLLHPDRLFTLAFILFMLWLIAKGIYKFFPFFAEFVDLVRTLVGNPKKGIPGIGERMEAQVDKLAELGDRLGEHGEKLETVRAQVQNSHPTNLRDDMDSVQESVNDLVTKLDQHIEISKAKDNEQESTARKLDRHIAETSKWSGMLQDLHRGYANKPRNT